MKITAEQEQGLRAEARRAGAEPQGGARVFLNGTEQSQVLAADDVAGTVTRAKAHGQMVEVDAQGNVATETLQGQVRIALPDWWPR